MTDSLFNLFLIARMSSINISTYEHMFYCCNKNSNTQKKINHENIKSKDYTQVQLEEMVYKLFNNNLTKFHYLFYWMSDEDVDLLLF